MKILVSGGGGYIGNTLVPHLLAEGHAVTVLDRFFFGKGRLADAAPSDRLALVRDDIRWFDGKLLKGFDAVVDMAALSNDPSGELDPWKTIEINYLGRSRVARLAREAGVGRYLLISSCSIYGFQPGLLTEESAPNPLTTYARANLMAERDNLPLAGKDFASSVIRFATVYGLSGRMRFDLAVNGMVLGAFKGGKIPVMKDGTQWRPFVHVKDAAAGIVAVLSAEISLVSGQIFNVGSDQQNFQIRDLAEVVASSLSRRPTIEWYGTPDTRSYRVSFEKARRALGYATSWTPADAAKEIESALISGEVDDSIKTKTVEWYKHLLSDPKAGVEVSLRGSVL
jgi:nucleoside-diphosphate-sugar epimerase